LNNNNGLPFQTSTSKNLVTIPFFKKYVAKKTPIQANTSNNQNFHVVSFTKNTNENEKNLL